MAFYQDDKINSSLEHMIFRLCILILYSVTARIASMRAFYF